MNTRKVLLTNLVTASAIFLLPLSSAHASEWSYTFAPYAWMAGLEGDIATIPGTDPAEVDISFSDIWDALDMAAMGMFEARNADWGVFTEVFYIDLSTDKGTPGPLFSTLDYEIQLTGITAGGLYPLIQDKENTLDLVAGVRFWNLDNELKLGAGIAAARTAEHDEDWVDGIAGLKGSARLTDNWRVSGWAVAGTGGSDSVFDVTGLVTYSFNEKWSASAGYRHQEIDYENDDFLFDVSLAGPILGMSYKF